MTNKVIFSRKIFRWVNAQLVLMCMIAPADVSARIYRDELYPVTACVWDPISQKGPLGKILTEMTTIGLNWGIDFKFKYYEDELLAIEEFKLGQCDVINLLGIRAKQFNKFTGTIDAIGALNSYEQLGEVIKTMNSPEAKPYLRNGEYEVIGIAPAGAVHVYLRNRKLLNPSDLAGKKIPVLQGLPEEFLIAKSKSMVPVNSSLFTAFNKFNNGAVDLLGTTLVAYEPFELYKGLGTKGGVYDQVFMMLTMQIIARWQKLPAGIAQKSRDEVIERFQDFVDYATEPKKRFPRKYWIKVPQTARDNWEEDHRQMRLSLADQGIYEPKTLTLMRRVRCKHHPESAECTADKRE